MDEQEKKYLKSLSQVNRVETLLSVAGFSPKSIENILCPVRSPYLDKEYSNISPRLRAEFPPSFVSDLSNVDRIRSRLAAVYSSSPLEFFRKKAKRIFACNSAFMMLNGISVESSKLIPYSCNSRFCPICSRERSQELFSRAHEVLSFSVGRREGKANLLWLTLTVKNPPYGSLDAALKTILSAWRTLRVGSSHRQISLWQSSVVGYIWGLEVTANLRSRSWHPHIHILADSNYMGQGALDALWNSALAKSGMIGKVMIGRAYAKGPGGKKIYPEDPLWGPGSLEGALAEVCKYTLKPIESGRLSADQILEITSALHNKRLMGSGGEWSLPAAEKNPPVHGRPEGFFHALKNEQNPTASLMDINDPLGIAHAAACRDPIWAAGLARCYGASAAAQALSKKISEKQTKEEISG